MLYAINIILAGRIIATVKPSGETNELATLHLTTIKADCEKCFDMQSVATFIASQKVRILTQKNLSSSDAEAKRLMSENGITTLPALVITGKISDPSVSAILERLAAKISGNAAVISGIPPYYNTETQKTEGLVNVIELTDNSCSECYDPELHMQILPRFITYVNNVTDYDISSDAGKELIQKYNITKVPTILLSPDASVYSSLTGIWNSVGTKESDGWHVFRATEQMGIYKDLANNTVVNATR